MSAKNFDECFALTLKYEGGFVNDPHDPGGATNMGITLATARIYTTPALTVAQLRAFKVSDVKPIYAALYWNKMKCSDLPSGVDFAVYDFGVNSGNKRSIMALQRACHVADDGLIGDVTLEAVKSQDPTFLINAICKDRLAFLKRLSNWSRYGKGWGARVADVKKRAGAMVETKRAQS